MRLRFPLCLILAFATTSSIAQTPPAGSAPAQPAAPAPQEQTPGSTPAQPAPAAPAPAAPAPAAPAPAVPAPSTRSTLAPGPNDPTDVQEVVLAAKPAAVLTGTTTWDDGFTTLNDAFRKIEAELAKANIPPTGRPVTVFVRTDDSGFSFEAMVPVDKVPDGRTDLTPEIKFGKTPEGKSLRFVHKDSYDEIDGTYETITAYLDAKDIVAKDAFIEEYVTDLTESTDANLEVNIYVQPKD
jgi:effector-binding domain-containing protein